MANNHLHTPSGNYDREWVDLILDAKKAGISREEIRNFLIRSNPTNNTPKSS